MTTTVHIVDGPVALTTPPSLSLGSGATLTFVGVVRPTEASKPLESIRYETYDPMAQLELERLVKQASETYRLNAIALTHSRGAVPVGHASLYIEIQSTHRREGLDAMDWLIDALKQDVPIWKHPVYSIEPSSTGRGKP